jgi:predicted aspartyl protease
MPMRFHYTLMHMPRPVASLGGRWVRPRPVVLVKVSGPGGTFQSSALLDTGADDTVFPARAAGKLGLDLTSAVPGIATGAGGMRVPVRYAQVTLRLSDGRETREWPALVAFTSARLNQPLLGFAGCLQFFDAQFFGAREEVELTVNSLYPGT